MASSDQARCATLLDLLDLRADTQGGDVALAFMEDGEAITETITYGELVRRARATAAVLRRRHPPGSCVLLLYPSGIDYMVGFFGALCAGMIAVPMFPPRGNKRNVRLEAIILDSGTRLGLTTARQLKQMEAAIQATPSLAELELVCTDAIDVSAAAEWRRPDVDPETVAFLQYTSGSTGQPKGVMVSHRNVLHNESMIQTAFASDASSVMVSWAPIFHDMGLIGCMLHAVWLGITCHFMAPVTFLQRPMRWLESMSRLHGTISGAPNFAYQLCAEKIRDQDKVGLDLSAWKVAFNGSEPVRYATMERFGAAFASCGFDAGAWLPCYGMAEATLAISARNGRGELSVLHVDKAMLARRRVVQTSPSSGVPLVGCGHSLPGQILRIVDPDSGRPCASGEVGEIWLQGPHISGGYWRRPDATEQTFGGRIAGAAEPPFLRTGDLGFLHGDEVYVAGRIKDVMILRGVNYYPQDIEASAEEGCPELNPAGAAAFAVEHEQGERAVLVAEVRRTASRRLDVAQLAARIRERVFEQHELMLGDVVLIRQSSLPKTSSGKVQRGQARALYASAGLDRIGAGEAVEAEA